MTERKSIIMQIVQPNKSGLEQAVQVLLRGGVIIYPTDTAYALGGIYNSRKVVKKILQIKNRVDNKFTIVAASLPQVEKHFRLTADQKKLAKRFWPAALSIVVSKKYSIRVPKNKVAQALANRVGRPLIATSANLSGQPTLYDSAKIIKLYQRQKFQPDLIIDAGRLKIKKTSTIVKVFTGRVEVIRAGAVKI